MNKETELIEPPSTWMTCSVFNLFRCCCPLGLVAAIFSVLTEKGNSDSNFTASSRYSKMAMRFNISSMAICVTTWIILILYALLGMKKG